VNDKVASAVELAREVIKERMPWHDAYGSAFFHSELRICSSFRSPNWTYCGDEHVVVEKDGDVIPTMSDGPGDWHQVYDDEKGAHFIELASKGDHLAHDLLCLIASRFIATECVMPERLSGYIVKVLETQYSSQRRRRGPDPYGNYSRDYSIAAAVDEVVRQDGFLPTRNEATEHESACSIVVMALKELGVDLGEKSVQAIWTRFAPSFEEGE
jgi:hypothetical protein